MLTEAERCKATVYPSTAAWGEYHRQGGVHQCTRRAVIDGFCRQHAKEQERYRQLRAARRKDVPGADNE